MRETEFLAILFKWFGPNAVSWVMMTGYEEYRQKLADGNAKGIIEDYLADMGDEGRLPEFLAKLEELQLSPMKSPMNSEEVTPKTNAPQPKSTKKKPRASTKKKTTD
jgi:hypothetical protein